MRSTGSQVCIDRSWCGSVVVVVAVVVVVVVIPKYTFWLLKSVWMQTKSLSPNLGSFFTTDIEELHFSSTNLSNFLCFYVLSLNYRTYLGGGFKYLFISPQPGGMIIYFDLQIICLLFNWVQSPTIWAKYNDLSRGHLKWWFSKGIPTKIPLIQVKELY